MQSMLRERLRDLLPSFSAEKIYFPFRENVPKSSSVSKTRANYGRKNSGRVPPQEIRHQEAPYR